ncbi:hypothetical protein VQL36_09500 [Chengkuizengella sp. SCS-71B]|uniref:hypothetical protein n=1 Tax=Chengkuizengella sp. SCS-71B TaxID=3115290 RepID=UPI0032C21990
MKNKSIWVLILIILLTACAEEERSIGIVDQTMSLSYENEDIQKLSFSFIVNSSQKIKTVKLDIVNEIKNRLMETNIEILKMDEYHYNLKGFLLINTEDMSKEDIVSFDTFINNIILENMDGSSEELTVK